MVGGKRYSVFAHTEDEAWQLLEAVHTKYRARQEALPPPGADQTLREFLLSWLKERRPFLAPKTYVGYRDYTVQHLIPGLGDHQLRDLRVMHVQAYIREKLAEGLSARTVHHHRAILRTALNWAVRWGLIEKNVASIAEGPKVAQTEIKPLTPKETRRFLEVARQDSIGTVYIVAATCGLRLSEVLGLTWEDINFENGTLSVRRGLHLVDGEYVIREQSKTKKSRRVIGLPQVAIDALREWREKQDAMRQDADAWEAPDLVFTTRLGRPLNGSWVTHHLHRVLRRAGLPEQRFHGLRHLAASLMLASGLSLNDVSRTLGHSQISLTADLYGHWYDEGRHRVATAMDGILGSAEEELGSNLGSKLGSNGETPEFPENQDDRQ
ncbi:MAG TPA: site-specific integrase [Chloroflexota bacterium]|nr:site-specific integrase [Chloroflexota bacterium]